VGMTDNGLVYAYREVQVGSERRPARYDILWHPMAWKDVAGKSLWGIFTVIALGIWIGCLIFPPSELEGDEA
jgi:hypothetical protein